MMIGFKIYLQTFVILSEMVVVSKYSDPSCRERQSYVLVQNPQPF